MYHLRNKQKGLSILLIIMILAGVLFSTIPVFAEENIQALTLDSENFTVIGTRGNWVHFDVKGLTHDWQNVDLTEVQADKVSLDNSDSNVAIANLNYFDNKEVWIYFKNEGMTTLTFSYDHPDVKPVTCNVFVEKILPKPDADNVKVTVKFNGEGGKDDFIVENLTVKRGEIKVNGITVDDVLTKSPTAFHALVKATDMKSIPLSLNPENQPFVNSIDGVEGRYDEATDTWYGWHYSVMHDGKWDNDPARGSGVYPISTNDEVLFEYKAFSW